MKNRIKAVLDDLQHSGMTLESEQSRTLIASLISAAIKAGEDNDWPNKPLEGISEVKYDGDGKKLD